MRVPAATAAVFSSEEAVRSGLGNIDRGLTDAGLGLKDKYVKVNPACQPGESKSAGLHAFHQDQFPAGPTTPTAGKGPAPPGALGVAGDRLCVKLAI